MGVPTLWKHIQHSNEHRNLARIAFRSFEENDNGLRGLKLGIDAPAWPIHAEKREWGASPEAEVFFWRCARLLSMGILPLFVFDGNHKPPIKRGGRSFGGRIDPTLLKMIELFGFEYRVAPGEAEAELAYLNSQGLIDAIMTDDVDTLLFGGSSIIRNWGVHLSGHGGGAAGKAKHSQAAASSQSACRSTPDSIAPAPSNAEDGSNEWVYTFSADRVRDVAGLDRWGLILCALMSRGDYDDLGIPRCGIEISAAMARCGFGEQLCGLALSAPEQLDRFLPAWVEDLRNELRTNARGAMKRKAKALADSSFPPSWPDPRLLNLYLFPATSATIRCSRIHGDFTWSHPPDLAGLAAFAYRVFEWPCDELGQRFRSKLWLGMLMDGLRRAALVPASPRDDLKLLGNPGPKRQRRHPDTGETLQYRIEFDPTLWASTVTGALPTGHDVNVAKAQARRIGEHEVYSAQKMAMTGSPSKMRAGPVIEDPMTPDRAWIPAVHLRIAAPGFIERCETEREQGTAKKRKSPTRKKRTPKKSGSVPAVEEQSADAPSMEAYLTTPTKIKMLGKKGREDQNLSDSAERGQKQARGRPVDQSTLSLRARSSSSRSSDLDGSDIEAIVAARTARPPKKASPAKRYIEVSSDSDDEKLPVAAVLEAKKSPKKKQKHLFAAQVALGKGKSKDTITTSAADDSDDDLPEPWTLTLPRQEPQPTTSPSSGLKKLSIGKTSGYKSDQDAASVGLGVLPDREPPPARPAFAAPESKNDSKKKVASNRSTIGEVLGFKATKPPSTDVDKGPLKTKPRSSKIIEID